MKENSLQINLPDKCLARCVLPCAGRASVCVSDPCCQDPTPHLMHTLTPLTPLTPQPPPTHHSPFGQPLEALAHPVKPCTLQVKGCTHCTIKVLR